MMKDIILVFEITTDSFWMKDVVQFPLAIAKNGEGKACIITRKNDSQTELSKHIGLHYLGKSSNGKFNFDLSKLKVSHFWYLRACIEASRLGEILILYPFFGNPILGAILFKLLRLLKLKTGKVIIKSDGYLQFLANRKSRLLKLLATMHFPFFDQIICENKIIYQKVIKDYPNLQKKIVYLPNCPLDIYHKQQIIDYNDRPKNFLFVGRVSDREKGADILLDNWISIGSRLPDWKIFLVGICSEEFKINWKTKLSEHDLLETVVWINGATPEELLYYYNHSRVVICSSRKESGPIILSEAALSGCAFIGTCVGEIPSVLSGLSGLVVNHEDLADLMIEFANNQSLAKHQAGELYLRMKNRKWEVQAKKVSL